MLNKLLHSRKAQVGETITWVVATLIIVFVISISVIAADFVGPNKMFNIDDKKKDLLATKSITGFLGNEKNVELLSGGKKEIVETKMKNFLEIISTKQTINPGGWNFEMERENDEINVDTYRILRLESNQYDFTLTSDKIKLHFWKECQGECK